MKQIDADKMSKLLAKLGACREAREWAKGKSLDEIWQACERGDWMLWLLAKMVGTKGWPTHKEVVSMVCDCVELALPYAKNDIPKKTLEVTRAWVCGEAMIEDVRAAAAYAADAYAYAASYAAAAAYAADAYTASYAAAYAAHAANDTAYNQTLKMCADIVRKATTRKALK